MIALLAIALPVLIGATGLVLDTGALYDLRRRTQAAADAAADAAAQEVRLQTGAESVKSAAVYDAKKNGFVDDKTTSIEVNQPPKLGHYKGNKNYVEVIITDEAPTFFMTALTDKHYDVRGRAVASVATNNICTWTLDPSASLSFDASGSAAVSFKDCGVFVNSNNSKAARTTGKATVSAPSINVVGNYTGSAFSPTPTTGASAITDPFAEVANPVVGSTCSYTNKTVKSAETLTPGTYCGGLTLNAKANATLKGGLYVLKGGGLTVNGQATMTGAGVTFFNTAGSGYTFGTTTINGGATVTLSAPTSGATKGLLFFDDRAYTGKTHTFNGGATISLTGAIYSPNTDLKMAGNFSGKSSNMILIAKNMSFTGTMSFTKMPVELIPPILTVAHVVE